MASLMRFRNVHKLAGRLVSAQCARPQQAPIAQQLCRLVGTSGAQKSETVTATASTADKATVTAAAETCTPKKKIWVSYGFSFQDEYLDNHFMHVTMFVTISFCVTFGAFLLMYLPDFRMRDWACREAYLELRRRESLGLLPIDPNLIDPAKVQLPTDEELGDTEIII